MVRKIDRDANRFKQIVRGKIKSDLRKYITHGEMIGKTGGEFVSIPLPQIEIPEFRYGTKNRGGVGQGPGDVGTPIGRSSDGEGGAGAGDAPGHHILEVELTMDDLAQILGEELALPRIEPKGRANIVEEKDKYTGIRQAGPESLRHFKRTYKKALKRQIASNTYDPRDPLVIPIREDKLYRSWNPIALPQFNAVVLYLMDVSGSMTDDQKEIVRTEAFWIDAWLKSQYDGVTTRYIIHDAVAREVDEHTFYHTRESGGTRISSAYNLANKIIDDQHPPGRLEHLRLPFLRRRQLGRGQPPLHQPAPRPAPPQVQPVLLRPGRKPLRLGRVLSRARRGVRGRGKPGALRDPQQGRNLRFDQGVPGTGAVTLRHGVRSADAMATMTTATAIASRSRWPRATSASSSATLAGRAIPRCSGCAANARCPGWSTSMGRCGSCRLRSRTNGSRTARTVRHRSCRRTRHSLHRGGIDDVPAPGQARRCRGGSDLLPGQ